MLGPLALGSSNPNKSVFCVANQHVTREIRTMILGDEYYML